jgi:fatty-acyl-CoA synthase
MGIGAICHTLNPRLSPADICYIADHGQDKLILVDLTFLPILGRIYKQLPKLKGIVVLTDRCVTGRVICVLLSPLAPL